MFGLFFNASDVIKPLLKLPIKLLYMI